jgi:hypothetical protein
VFRRWRVEAAAQHPLDMGDWRTWTFRGQRLQRYLDDHPMPPVFNEPDIR